VPEPALELPTASLDPAPEDELPPLVAPGADDEVPPFVVESAGEPLPAQPTKKKAVSAKQRVVEIMRGFPFASDFSRANAARSRQMRSGAARAKASKKIGAADRARMPLGHRQNFHCRASRC
jgi:hypothetical protein